MPVRFLCPACHQLLSIATRKIGAEVECPKCRSTIIVPDPRDSHASELPNAETPSLFEQAGLEQALSAISASDKGVPPTAAEPAPQYDSSPANSLFPQPAGDQTKRPNDDSLVVISRRVLYLQAALLAIVGLVAFFCGYVIGGAGK
jgi:hypothetical protein